MLNKNENLHHLRKKGKYPALTETSTQQNTQISIITNHKNAHNVDKENNHGDDKHYAAIKVVQKVEASDNYGLKSTKSQLQTQPNSTKAHTTFCQERNQRTGFSPKFTSFNTPGISTSEIAINLQDESSANTTTHIVPAHNIRYSDPISIQDTLIKNLTTAAIANNTDFQQIAVNQQQNTNVYGTFQQQQDQQQQQQQQQQQFETTISMKQHEMLLTLVEKTQQLAQESEMKLKEREREHQERVEQIKLMHTEEITKLNAEIKIIQGLKNLEAQQSFDSIGNTQFTLKESRNQVIDNIRGLLVEEIDQIKQISEQKEYRLRSEIQKLEKQNGELRMTVQGMQKENCEVKVKMQQIIQELEYNNQVLQQELGQQKELYAGELDKLKLQHHLMRQETVQADKQVQQSQQNEDLKTKAFTDLLNDFKMLQEVLGQHDSTTAEQMNNIQTQRYQSEKFYLDKIRSLENQLKKVQNQLQNQIKMSEQHQTEYFNTLQNLQEQRNNEMFRFREVGEEVHEEVSSQLNKIDNDHQQTQTKTNNLIQNIQSLNQLAFQKLSFEQNPNYKQSDIVIKSLQQENQQLRQQVDDLQTNLKIGTTDENQSLIRLKFSLKSLLSTLRDKIQTFHTRETEKDNSYALLESRLQELDQIHSTKEIESSELIQQLTEEIQDLKFNLRKQESFNQESSSLVHQLQNTLDQKTLTIENLNQTLEVLLQNNNNNNNTKDLNSQMKDVQQVWCQAQEKYYSQKIGKIKSQTKELQEKHDELLIRYCRAINKNRTNEMQQLQTWQSRQQAYVDQLKHQREQINQLTNQKAHELIYQQLQEAVSDSLIIEQELLSKFQMESEVEYQRQVQILDKEIENLRAQKQSLIKIVQDYELHYTSVTQERFEQNELLNDLNSKLSMYVNHYESLHLAPSSSSQQQNFPTLISTLITTFLNPLHELTNQLLQNQTEQQNLLKKTREQMAEEYLTVVEYLQEQLEQVKSGEIGMEERIVQLQEQLEISEKNASQQRVQYYEMRQLFENNQSRQQAQSPQNHNEQLSLKQSHINHELDTLLDQYENSKKIQDKNQAIRELKQLINLVVSSAEIDKKYAGFIAQEKSNNMQRDIDNIKRQKELLLLQISGDHTQTVQKLFDKFTKDYLSIEQERSKLLETENELLTTILSSNHRDKYKELKDLIKQYITTKNFDNSMLLQATTGIKTLNQTSSQRTLHNSSSSQQNLVGPLVFLSPSKSNAQKSLNATQSQMNLTMTMNMSYASLHNLKNNTINNAKNMEQTKSKSQLKTPKRNGNAFSNKKSFISSAMSFHKDWK